MVDFEKEFERPDYALAEHKTQLATTGRVKPGDRDKR